MGDTKKDFYYKRLNSIWSDLISQTQKRLDDISLAILGGFALKHGILL